MVAAHDRPIKDAENRLEHFNADREQLLGEVERRVVARRVADSKAGGDASLEYVLNDVAYCEIRRHEASKTKGLQLDRWRDLSRRLLGMSDEDKQAELRSLVRHYGHDVVGNFDPRVYKFATGLMPSALDFFFSPVRSLREGMAAVRHVDARIHADGETDLVRACAERGTIVVTPTHSSNMDSPAIGLALMRAGLPPVTYGAGKNLFSNPLISFFMRNLGAYRVDRRLKFRLYNDVLKEYSTVLLEHGYHSLFFPGGTRCRSNIIEKQLKLGLLGTTVTAYKNSVREGAAGKRIYIVPATINYRLVLEAETLVGDYLAEAGKSRYIITDDEFSRVGRWVEFFRKILVHEGSVIVRFGRPLDVFGNDITDGGDSIDRAGRVVDPASFVRGASGEVSDDDQRDAEYTRTLGRRLAAAYPRLTVFHATHLVARALYDAIAEAHGTRDVYRLMRAPAPSLIVPLDTAIAHLLQLRTRLATHPEWGSEHPQLPAQAAAVVADAVAGLSSYHTKAVVVQRGPRGEMLGVEDVKLLYYYANRTAHVPGGVVTRADTVGIVGAGTFGTALASALTRAGKRVVLWSRDVDVVAEIEETRRCRRLPAAVLPPPLVATADPKRLAAEARFLVLAVVSTDVRERARELGDVLDGSHIVVHAIGALATPHNERVSEVVGQGIPTLKIGALAGPALPADLVEGNFASMVIASPYDEVVNEGRRLLNVPPALRVYGTRDLVGVELASALSGAYTVALGLCDGLEVGDGPRAVLVTRAVAEASRLGVAAGAEARTFAGLAGLGNLLVRAHGDRSPDYVLGRRFADGVISGDTLKTEGARAALAMAELAQSLKIRMPVLQGVAAILAHRLDPKEAVKLIGDQVATEE